MLTAATIQAAQDNDLAALGTVLTELEPTVSRLAAEAARRMPAGYGREDLEQDAREALFTALGRFDASKLSGDIADGFTGFMFQTMRDALKDRVREQRYAGADKDAVKVFMSFRSENESPYETARRAMTEPKAGQRLSADRAYAALHAFESPKALDAPAGEDGYSLADTLAAPAEPESELRPKVGFGAAREALAVIMRYCPVGFDLRGLTMTDVAELAAVLEDVVHVPAGEAERRYVLDAFAILRSAASTSTESEVSEELRDVSDERTADRAAKIAEVRTALAMLPESRRKMLTHAFGIDGAPEFGWGDGCDRDGMAAYLGMTLGTCKVNLSQARKLFAEAYIKVVAARSETLAEVLRIAFAAGRKHAGRK